MNAKKPMPKSPTKSEPWATSRPIDSILPYEKNPRLNAAAVPKVARSIQRFGFQQPIVVDEHMVILAGHTRLLAARQLGLVEVPVRVAVGLTPAEARAYRLADNRTAQDATWADDLLAGELKALGDENFDLAWTGFDQDEIDKLLGDTSEGGVPPDTAPPPPDEPVTRPGDLILLGDHRLVCGDATDAAAWRPLCGEERGNGMWTDPPYGVGYADKNAMLNAVAFANRIQTPIENDHIDEAALQALLHDAFTLATQHLAPGSAVYVAAPAGPLHHLFAEELKALGCWRHTLQWVKDGFVLGRADYHYRHEPIFYGWTPGAAHTWLGGRSQDTVLEFPRPKASPLHPTMKPVALVQRCLENSWQRGATVIDPFGGSGTTLLAAEAAGRRAWLMELSPHYCDVIVQRWEEHTGRTAQRPGR